MRLISTIVYSTATVGASLVLPAVASATDLHCSANNGVDITIVNGPAGCRAATDTFGQARAEAYDGVGYARATIGALAYGLGAAGGVGASDGVSGIPIAIGFGPDAHAFSTIAGAGEHDSGNSVVVLSIAINGSRASAHSSGGTVPAQATTGSPVACLGPAAFAWNSATGDVCLNTPFGHWETRQPAANTWAHQQIPALSELAPAITFADPAPAK